MLGKLFASLIILLISLALASILGAALGCLPAWSLSQWCLAVLLTLLGSCAAAAWALTLAGNVRAEAVLAIANGIFIALVIAALLLPGPLAGAWATAVLVIPSVALAHGLSDPNWTSAAVLLAWSVVGVGVVSRRFSWDD